MMATRFVLRFERGSRSHPDIKGNYLAWQNGFLRPCASESLATHYVHSQAAADVAMRAAGAFPGAKLAVLPVFA